MFKVNSALDNINLKERTESEKQALDQQENQQKQDKNQRIDKDIESDDDDKTVQTVIKSRYSSKSKFSAAQFQKEVIDANKDNKFDARSRGISINGRDVKSQVSQQMLEQISSLEKKIKQELNDEIDATRKKKDNEGIKKDSNEVLVPLESSEGNEESKEE